MRILFVTKEYLPKPTPPGLCIMNVQEALLNRGVQSDVLMVGDEEGLYSTNKNGEVYSIKSDVSFEKQKVFFPRYLIRHLLMLFTWPVPSTKRVKDYRRMITKLNKEKEYDAIIGTLFPADVCLSCSVFDHFFIYEFDSLVNNPVYKVGIKKHLKFRLKAVEKRLYDRAELIIHLNNNKEFYNKDKYKKYVRKSVYTDIPYITNKSVCANSENIEVVLGEISNSSVVIVYAGLLSRDYRSPSKLIELVKDLSKYIDVKCLFFSRGDCEEELRKAETDTNGVIKRMGYVPQAILRKYMDRADFFLDIGNHLSGEDYSLPSKVIEYIATGKPIIHMNGVNDSAINYLEKYGNAINVSEDISADDARKEVLKFIKEAKGRRIPFENVVEKFPQNTPEYTADLIIKQIERRRSNTGQ